MVDQKLWTFSSEELKIQLPEKFTFPFYYQPHPLALAATKHLQDYLTNEFNAPHNFGLGRHEELLTIGKMFGVLVVQSKEGKLHFLAGFSGKLAESNHHDRFVPPVFDILTSDGFFRKGEQEVNEMTILVEKAEKDSAYSAILQEQTRLSEQLLLEKIQLKESIKENKILRDLDREKCRKGEFDANESAEILKNLNEKSKQEQLALKKLQKRAKELTLEMDKKVQVFVDEIERLKQLRREKSNEVQQMIFEHYTFLNRRKETKSLHSIFETSIFPFPPAGAGECAAPKLLQYAFTHDLKPICFAEFWWGASPKSEVKQHLTFYPACKGKCEPILGHMLADIAMDENPMLQMTGKAQDISIIYEDQDLLVINKPHEFLSVPGRQISESVYTYAKEIRPEMEGPIIVHRLDMSTSGVMVLAKNLESYHLLQKQFVERKVQKTYIALLDGEIENEKGKIDLPLMLDILDRPKQKVDDASGKQAITYWERLEILKGRTRIKFHPKTGRTHQLRVHSAHYTGLNAPIVGDDLYGKLEDRLHLHAYQLILEHPRLKKKMTFVAKCPF